MASVKTIEPDSSPRISFSTDFLDERNFISISPNSQTEKKEHNNAPEREKLRNADFEFLSSSNSTSSENIITADELFFEGKLLPFWQMHHSEKLSNISLKSRQAEEGEVNKNNNNNNKKEEPKMSWFLDDDPSPRPPTCTVLWKELLRLKKQRPSSLSSSSSTSSSSSSSGSLGDMALKEESKDGVGSRENYVKRIKKGLERTRSASLRIRPMVNLPICTPQVKSNPLPPLFSLKKG